MHRTVGPIFLGLMALAGTVWAQDPPGRQIFEDRCGTCHGADGNGGEHAPAITRAAPDMEDAQLTTLIREGLPARGMPAIGAPCRAVSVIESRRAPASASSKNSS